MEEVKTKKKSKKKYIYSILFLVLMIVVTFYVIFNKYDIKDLKAVLKEANYIFILIGIVFVFIYIFFEGMATKILLKSVGYKTSIGDNFVYAAVDYYFCAVTPSATGGQPMSAYYMACDHIPVESSSLILMINTAFFKIVFLVLSLISIFFCHELLSSSVLLTILIIVGALINITIVIFLFLCTFKNLWVESVGKRIIIWLYKIKLVKKPYKIMRKFKLKMQNYKEQAILLKKNKKEFVLALLCNFVQRTAMFCVAYFVYLSLLDAYPKIQGHTFIEFFAIQVLIGLSVDSLPFPGGMGISEFLYLITYGTIYNVIINGVETSLVPSAMLLTRAVSFYIPLIVTSIIVVIKHISALLKSKNKNKELVL